jgi:hypothetical protein
VAVSRLPQRVLAVFVAHWAFSHLGRNIYTRLRSTTDETTTNRHTAHVTTHYITYQPLNLIFK